MSVNLVNSSSIPSVTMLIGMDLAAKGEGGTDAGGIYFALYDRKFQAVLTTRRIVKLNPSPYLTNGEIPWTQPNVFDIYTDKKTEDLFLILVRPYNENDSATYYGFDPSKLKKVSNQAFRTLLDKAEELPAPKATVDDVMDLFDSAKKVNRRVLWSGHGALNKMIAGMTTEDFIKAHQRLNAMRPEIEGVVSCYVGGKHRLALSRIPHEHPVILVGADDLEGATAFSNNWKTISRNLDNDSRQKHTVESIRALMDGVREENMLTIHDEPQVILPLQKGVRLIDPSRKFIILTADSKAQVVSPNHMAALYTSYIGHRLVLNHDSAYSCMLTSQIAGEAHHLFEEIQLPCISYEAFLKSLVKSWIPSKRTKAFFIKKFSLKDRRLENVILTNMQGGIQFIYRVQDQEAHYFLYRDGVEKEIDSFTYFCKVLEILKDSKPSTEAVKLATGGLEEDSVYQRIRCNFMLAHAKYNSYKNLFTQFDEPQNKDLSKEIAALLPDQRAKLLALSQKYDCQPLIKALQA